ncbi:MAG: uroporphyrinogen decarboxylase family protein [bacterium]
MEKLNHRDRLQTIFANETPDRFAASFWRHFFHREHHARGTAEAMIDFQKFFDWDFVKINPRADYHVEDWGVHLDYSHKEFTKHAKSNFPVSQVGDWAKIEPLNMESPALAEHLRVVSLVRKGLGTEVPILMTVFTPLAIAGRLVADRQTLIEHIKRSPKAVHTALEGITETFMQFVVELRNAGADGIFYATTQWASSDMLTWEEYQEFGLPYDLKVAQATQDGAINLLHVCSSNNYLTQLPGHDYHAQMLNWDSCDPTNLPLDRADEVVSNMAMVGGADQEGWLRHATSQETGFQIEKLKTQHSPARLIIGPGCAIPPETPTENLQEIRKRL